MPDKYQDLRDALAESSAYFRFPGESTYCKPDGPAANMLRALLKNRDALREALSELVTCHACGGFVEPDPSVMNAARAALADGEASDG